MVSRRQTFQLNRAMGQVVLGMAVMFPRKQPIFYLRNWKCIPPQTSQHMLISASSKYYVKVTKLSIVPTKKILS